MNHDTSNVGVTPHFSIGQNLLKKKYWEKKTTGNQLTIHIKWSFPLRISSVNVTKSAVWEKLFDRSADFPSGKIYWKKYWKKEKLTQSIEKSFLIGPLQTWGTCTCQRKGIAISINYCKKDMSLVILRRLFWYQAIPKPSGESQMKSWGKEQNMPIIHWYKYHRVLSLYF